MRKRWIVAALAGLLLTLPAAFSLAQSEYGYGLNPYAQYDSSSLMGGNPGAQPGQTQMYYPDWYNYLDTLQQQGGYYSVTGNYPQSAAVTSYYPASSMAGAAQAGPRGQAADQTAGGMYYNPAEYYGAYGQQAQQQAPQAYQQQAPQAYQQQAPQAYQQPAQSAAPATPPTKRKLSSKKKPTTTAKRQVSPEVQAQAQAQVQAYYQQLQQQQYSQQPQYGQQQAHPQQAAAQPQQQSYYQQGQPQYPQQQGYGRQGYAQQQGYPQPQQPEQPQQMGAAPQFGGDPTLQRAQQEALERAAARQRAAELATQQQGALQELQQARQLFDAAQSRVKAQEDRQRSFQEEFHKKQVQDSYERLKEAQQRYYELQGVGPQSGGYTSRYQTGPNPQQGGQQPTQYPEPVAPQGAQVAQPGYGQSPAPGYGPQAPDQYAGAGAPSMAPPQGQVTPLHVQPTQQPAQEGRGFWSTLKEILAPAGVPNRAMFDKKPDPGLGY